MDTFIKMSRIPHRNILVFDTETTGLIPKSKEVPLEMFPCITQFSFIVYDTQLNNIRSSFNAYIKLPPGIEIPHIVTEITGITNEKCDSQGIPIEQVLGIFYQAMTLCDCVIAHNLDFDMQMVNIELKRHSIRLSKIFPNIQYMFHPSRLAALGINLDCTMKMTTESCALYRSTEKNHVYKKFPKLSETYFHLFQETPTNLHNSMVDTIVCLRCYLKFRFGETISDERFVELIELNM
jgi:DNA polymerase III epsilon subunit-like protein